MSCGFNGRELSEEENKLRRRIAELEATIAELKAREEKHNRVEKRLATECAVTRVLAESKSPGQAVTGTLRVICECIGWRLGDFWSVDHDSDMLYYKEGWHKRSAKAEKFELASKQYTFLPGIGLPGRVLLSGKPNWILDVVKDRNFLRASIAAEVGFHSAFGFPIMLGDKILGVMEFFCNDIQEPDEKLLEFMESLGGRIGDFNWNNWHDTTISPRRLYGGWNAE